MPPLEGLEPAVRKRFTSYASTLAAHVDELAERAVSRIRAKAPQYAVDVPELAEALSAGARPSILAELVAMQEEAALPDRCPAVDAEGARLAARFGVPIDLTIWVYRAGHSVQWEGWFRLVERHEGDAEARRALLEAGSEFFFAYADRMSRWATEEYTAERDRMLRGREQRRVNLVRELLAGRNVDAGGLDYNLSLHHLGVIAWGPDAADSARALAKSLDRRLLIVGAADDTWWAWLGGRSYLSERGRATLRRWRPPQGTRFVFGEETDGHEGFRSTHEEAVAAHRIAGAEEAPVTHYEDVALEVLAGRDPERARAFVSRELRGLDGEDIRSRRLRETLRAYFAAHQNAAAAAAALGIHEQTVAQRLRAVERRTGRSVAARRAELDTALRLGGER
ncbi:MAG: helix-turn-helix domain-containing protein [Actinomycetota bacterium]